VPHPWVPAAQPINIIFKKGFYWNKKSLSFCKQNFTGEKRRILNFLIVLNSFYPQNFLV
jgi:hypothetical protein